MSALAELAADADVIAGLGHNGAPEPTPFDAHLANITDLYTEAQAWCDGEPITTPAQAEKVELLLDMIREAHAAADESRKVENEPFDTGKAAVQAKYAPLISDTKGVKGKTVLASAACLAALAPWRKKIADEKAAEAQRLQDLADEKARLARDALEAAEPTNLVAREEAQALITEAASAQKVATRADANKGKGNGLRTVYTPVLTDGVVAARHYWATNREACEAFFTGLAKTDVLAGKRAIPGFNVTESKVAV